ncbi:hypothetical protein [Calothrix sp. NIES-2098]|uniref:hypothetical protein n=1 Tax=Calothrix sp. NIES-2098 TaxID=1954171 RepID=UPI000BBC23F6
MSLACLNSIRYQRLPAPLLPLTVARTAIATTATVTVIANQAIGTMMLLKPHKFLKLFFYDENAAK